MDINLIGLSGKKSSGKDLTAKIIQYLTSPDKDQVEDFNEWKAYRAGLNSKGYADRWETKQFAGKLKQIVALLIGCKVEDLENEEFKSRPLGEEWRRYYWYHYKFATNENLKGKLGAYHSNTDDAEIELNQLEYSIWNKMRDEAELKSEIPTVRMLLQEIGTEGLRGTHPLIHINGTFAEYKEKEEYVGGSGSTSYSSFYYPKWILTDCRFKNEAKAIKDRGGIILRVQRFDNSEDTHISETELDNYPFDAIIMNHSSIEDLVIRIELILKDFKII